MSVLQEVARRSVTKTQVEVENGEEEEEVAQTVSILDFLARFTCEKQAKVTAQILADRLHTVYCILYSTCQLQV